MIQAEVFYPAFAAAFEAAGGQTALRRQRGKLPKYTVIVPAGSLGLAFRVNPKASALPYQAGEFWPDIQIDTLRHNARDAGLISWYQYTDAAMESALRAQQERVLAKVAAQDSFEPPFWRDFRDLQLNSMRAFIDQGFAPGWPQTALYYLDAADATAWGTLLGQQLTAWLAAFNARPETLEAAMWRLHWSPPGD